MVDNGGIVERSFENREWVKKFIADLPLYILFASTGGFLASFIFNLGFFYFFGWGFLSIFSLKDYLEGSLPLIFLSLAYLLYCINFEGKDIHEKAKEFIDDYKNITSEIVETHPVSKFIKKVIFAVVMVSIFILQSIGLSTTMFILCYWIYSTNNIIRENTEWSHTVLNVQIQGIILYLFALFFIKRKPEKFRVRKKISLFIISAYIVLFSYGLYRSINDSFLNADVTFLDSENKEMANGKMLRSIDKGVFYFDKKEFALHFLNWNEIASIKYKLDDSKTN